MSETHAEEILISKEKYFFIVVHPQLALFVDFLFKIIYVWGPPPARLTRNKNLGTLNRLCNLLLRRFYA